MIYKLLTVLSHALFQNKETILLFKNCVVKRTGFSSFEVYALMPCKGFTSEMLGRYWVRK